MLPPAAANRASVLLIGATLLWGLSFPLVKSWQAAVAGYEGGNLVSSLTLILVRMTLAVVILVVLQPRLLTQPTWRAFGIGAFLGVVNWVGLVLQVVGLATTTPARSGFLTSLASAWVPLLAFVFLRTRVAGMTLLGLTLGILGAAVLSLTGDETLDFNRGDFYTAVASLLFGVTIILLDGLGKTVPPGHLTVGFLGGTAAASLVLLLPLAAAGPGVGAWHSWAVERFQDPRVVRDVIALTFFCTVLAFHWMNTYQPQVPASRAALIYLLEPVFASAFSLAWGYDELTRQLLLGGALILGGNLLVELPAWLRAREAPVP